MSAHESAQGMKVMAATRGVDETMDRLGSPAAGTPLMVAAPGTALDLPLKVLAWQDAADHCWVSFNTPEYLQQRHGFPAALMANVAGLEKLVQAAIASQA